MRKICGEWFTKFCESFSFLMKWADPIPTKILPGIFLGSVGAALS